MKKILLFAFLFSICFGQFDYFTKYGKAAWSNKLWRTDGLGQFAPIKYGESGTVLFSAGTSSPPYFGTLTLSNITATPYSVFYTDVSGVLHALTLGTSGYVLKSAGPTGTPYWAVDATGGGAGTDINDLIDDLSGMMYYSYSNGDIYSVALGLSGTFLKSNGAGGSIAPEFSAIAASNLSDYSSIGMLNQNETITGNWVNTAYPWGVNEIGAVDMDVLEGGTAYSILGVNSTGYEEYTPWGAAATFLGGNGTTTEPSFQTLEDSDIPNNITTDGTAHIDMDGLEGGTAYSILGVNSTGYEEYTPWGAVATVLSGNGTTTEPSFQYFNVCNAISTNPWRMFFSGSSTFLSEIVLNGNGYYLRSNGVSVPPSFSALDMDDLQGGTAYSVLGVASTGYKEYSPWGAAHTVYMGNGTTTEPSFQSLADIDIPDAITVDMDGLNGGSSNSIVNAQGVGNVEYTPWGAAATFLGGNGTTTEPSFRALQTGDIPDLSGTYQPLHANLTSLSNGTVDMDYLESGTAYSILNAGSTGQQDYTAWGAGSTYLRGNGTTTEPSFAVIDPNQLQDGSYGYMYYSYTNGYLLGVALGANGTMLESNGAGGGTAPSFVQNIQTINFTVTGSEHIVGSNQDLPGWKVPFDIYVIKVSGFCDAGTVTLNVEERAATTPNTNGTNILYVDLVVDTDQQEATTSSGHPTVEEDRWIVPEITSKTGTPTILSITVKYYKNE